MEIASTGARAAGPSPQPARLDRPANTPHRLPQVRLRVLALAISILAVALIAPAASQASPFSSCPAGPTQIKCENALPGDPEADWQTSTNGDPTIQGYTTQMSVTPGSTVSFKIKTDAHSYHIDILRIGYYSGDGARKIVSNMQPTATLPQSQPACLVTNSTGLVDCGNWAVSASWAVPSDAISGLYVAHLVRDDTGGDSLIPFVVRNDSSHSAIVYQTSDETWQAYNTYGGNSLYTCDLVCPPGNPQGYQGAFAVSYNRPDEAAASQATPWYSEFPMIRFLEANGYDVSYIAEADADRSGSLLLNHKIFISSGHDEYWSGQQRANVLAARDAGVNLAFFSGNEMFWKTRWANSSDGSNTPYRTLITYKETHFNSPVDPQDPPTWTGTWGDSRFSPPADGRTPTNALTGQEFHVNAGTATIQVPYAYSKDRLWRNTAVARLTSGQTASLAPDTLGYEWDVDADNGYRPAGMFDLSSTTVSGLELITDYGTSTIDNGTATHNLTLYRAASGALVFGAGTVQWSWGLDSDNPDGNSPNVTQQQATVNLFADMGVQPQSLIAGLTSASQSTDTTAPTSTITSPTSGSTVTDGSKVTVSGTATDFGGGVVAGIEVSADNGTTWHPASISGRADSSVNWTYTWVAHGNPTATLKTRAVDDSGNIRTSSGISVNVNCPCSLWGNNVAPPSGDADSLDGAAITVGVKFKSDTFGQVSGIRFYKAAANTGTHIGSLWSSSGQLLASATFTNESGSGWQTVTFSSPVSIMPNTTYIAGYFAPAGHYARTLSYFYPSPAPTAIGGASIDSAPLHALDNTNGGDGVFAYGSQSTFPSSSFSAGNYWVDVSFTPSPAPGQVTGVTATAGKGSATVTWSAPTTGGPVTSYVVTPFIGSTAQTATTLNGTPPARTATIKGLTPGTQYTFRVQASNPSGSGPISSASNAVTPTALTAPLAPTGVSATPGSSKALVSWTTPSDDGGSAITGYTVTPFIGSQAQTPGQAGASATSATVAGLTDGTSYTFKVTAINAIGSTTSSASTAISPADTVLDFGTPALVDSGDGSSVNVGMKFTSSQQGTVTGVRFYKAATNTGTHIGSLWTAGGQLLGSATFTNETASGWQTVLFSQPVQINPGTTYVVSYADPNGHYSFTSNGFGSAVTNGELQAPANSTTANGVYNYSGTNSFPSSSFGAANYWVDVLFVPAPKPGQVTGVSATAGAGAATVTWTAPSTGGPPTSYVITPFIGSTAQSTTTITGSPPATTATISNLQAGTQYTFTVHAANGNGSGPESASSNAVTPTAKTAPSAPTGVSANPASSQALVSWSAPSSDGGSAITGYTVTPFIGSQAQTPVQAGASATSATVTGLTDGTSYTFKVTATNAIGSTDSAASSAITPADTVFDFATPSVVDGGDGSSVNVGMKFSSSQQGLVTGVRFYKAAANTGTHIGSLWTSSGQLLASATFTNETTSGWQSVQFSQPVQIDTGTTYVVSYVDPNGHYSFTNNAFGSAVNNGELQAPPNSTTANGVYAYSGTNTFPTSTFAAANYWVDVLFVPTLKPGQVTGVTATAGLAAATVSWNAPSSGGAPTSYVVTPYIGSSSQTPVTITGTPPATSTTVKNLQPGTQYTFTVHAANVNGSGPESTGSNAVTPLGSAAPTPPTGVTATPATSEALVTWTAPSDDGGSALTGYAVTPYIGSQAQTPVQVGPNTTSTTVTGLTNGTSYTFKVTATNGNGSTDSVASAAIAPEDTVFDFATPATVDSGDGGSNNLGVSFTSSVPGVVTGIRFYKASTNTGTHIGDLWSAAGGLLASATFTNETSSGWQTVVFDQPVQIDPGTTYVASYFAPNGHYSFTSSVFTTALTNGPLQANADGASPNGSFAYSSANSFPRSGFNASNFWVDLLFQPSQ
jgi:Domain of unknown function (DUF4082)/Fibronectin type III domain/Mo-co oxidoreductase dimerisation domain